MEPDLRNSPKMSDDDDDDFKNYETSKGGSGKRRTTRNESEKRRRDKLNIYINELASMVPTCAASQKKLDKTTILKMTVNYMRIHNDLTGSVLGQEYGLHMSFLSSSDISGLLDESLNGFMFVLSRIGEVVYMSQSITPLLGYEVDEIIGKNLIEVVHPEDKSTVVYELSKDNKDFIMQSDFNGLRRINSKPERHTFDIRIECVPDKHFTDNQDSYEMVHVIGYTDVWESKKPSPDTLVSGCKTVSQREEQILTEKPRCLVALGILTRPGLKRFTTVNESTPAEFESRHTMDGKFLFVDPRSITLTGFWPYELLGTSLYSYVHHDDMQMLASVHQLLLEYGECKTEPYRMRSKGDQWLWMKSRSFISYNHWNSKPEFFCSTNVAVCNKEGIESLRERTKASLCSPVHTSIVPIRNNSSSTLYPYKDQQETNLMALGMAVQPENVVQRNAAACKEVVPIINDLSSNYVPPVNSVNSSDGKHLSTESQHQSCDDVADTDSTDDSMDLTMSFEELENFIEAQGQLHDQLMTKHSLLEETITKQKQQLQAIQQQMLLNLQAQLTINPGANQELLEEQFKRTKRVSEMHEKHETTQKELVQTLKERRRQTEKRNQRQLKYYLEKRMKVSSADTPSLPQASQSTNLDTRTNVESESINNIVNVTVLEEKRTKSSDALMHEHYTSTGVQRQVEHLRERNQKDSPVPLSAQSQRTVQYPIVSIQGAQESNICYASDGRQPVADEQLFSTTPGMTPSYISEQEAFQAPQQSVYPRLQELVPQRIQQSFVARGEKPNLPSGSFPAGFTSQTGEQPPTTLSNIQSLLTASSQNPESMQKLLSGLSSQPDVAQTLLGLLKQAQASGSSEQDSLLFDQSLQKTTNHFSSALGTDGLRNDNAQNMSYQFDNVQGLQKQQNLVRGASAASSTRNVGQQMQSRTRISSTSRFSTSTWSGSLSGEPSSVGSPFLQHTGQTPRNQPMESRVNEKQKDNKKDYFSNFSSQELEAMFLTTSPKPPPRTTARSLNSVEEAKLQEEQLMHSPLLIQQQQLLQMHQDQRKQLLVRQQEQLLMANQNQKHDQTQQPINVSHFTDDSQQSSLRSLLSDTNHPSTSTREQDQQASTSNSEIAQPSASWDSLSSNNFGLNEADEQVLNMLLAESSMDTLLDPSPWPETDNLLDYLNMNPDLTSD